MKKLLSALFGCALVVGLAGCCKKECDPCEKPCKKECKEECPKDVKSCKRNSYSESSSKIYYIDDAKEIEEKNMKKENM